MAIYILKKAAGGGPQRVGNRPAQMHGEEWPQLREFQGGEEKEAEADSPRLT